MPRFVLTAVLTATVLSGLASVAPAPTAAGSLVSVNAPATAPLGRSFAVTLRLPEGVAAVDGRILVDTTAAEIVGVAPVGRGVAFRPVEMRGGASFGAYDLRSRAGMTALQLVLYPRQPGRLQVRLIVDTTGSPAGTRLDLSGADRIATVRVGGGNHLFVAPRPEGRRLPQRTAQPAREVEADGRIDRRDLDTVDAGWDLAQRTGATCGGSPAADANRDGCVDILDSQATLVAQGQRTTAAAPTATGGRTFTVISPADTADATPGDGICADSTGVCTLRAAMKEANWTSGDDRIEFNLPGPVPVLIQVTSTMPCVCSGSGSVFIDGYSQPGSRANDAPFGSNAIPGVELRGNGSSAKEIAFSVTSPNNTIRGLLIQNFWRSIVLDKSNAHDNRVLGNWMGFRSNGLAAPRGQFAVVLNTGANRNMIGSPDLADRNVIGNHSHAIESYGPGTDFNTIQNNLLCIAPSGFATAPCDVGIDHNFGPKNSLIGGNGPNERNVIGATYLQGIEFSHGWDPALGSTNGGTLTYQINGHRVVGNWVGFRGDGSYDAGFRSGLNLSRADNGQAINVYDGSNDNVIENNHLAAVYDGIQFMSTNAFRNTARGNIIGASPLGEAAPLTGWGLKIRLGTKFHVVEANTIRNAALGGVGLVKQNSAPAYNVRITRNIVTDTNGWAIDLYGISGPDPNDPGDGDSGANMLLNTPENLRATPTLVSGTATKGLTVELYRASRGAGQYGLPLEYLGSAVASSTGTWSIPVSLAAGDFVTALQIRSNGETSELSVNAPVQ